MLNPSAERSIDFAIRYPLPRIRSVSPRERDFMFISLDMINTRKTKYKKVSEDQKEIIGILLAFVVMAIIFWFILISLSVSESREPQSAAMDSGITLDSSFRHH